MLHGQDFTIEPSVTLADLTNDGVPEVVVRAYESLVFMCQDGAFMLRLSAEGASGDMPAPGGDKIADLNANGMPELVLADEFWGMHDYTLMVKIYEWNGAEFQSLIPKEQSRAPSARNGYGELGYAAMWDGHFELVDVDGNGTTELVIEGGVGGGLDALLNGGPQRSERNTWMWNGTQFIFTDVSFSAPEYRFQAIQDGDDASLTGEFDRAIRAYRASIEDDHLNGWNPRQAWFRPTCSARNPRSCTPSDGSGRGS